MKCKKCGKDGSFYESVVNGKIYTRKTCISCCNEKRRKRSNSDEFRKKKKKEDHKYYENNKDIIKKRSTQFQKNNPEKVKQWASNRLPKRREYQRKYLSDPNNRLAHNLRNRLNRAVKRQTKVGSAVALLGCSIQELKKRLETMFEPGMTWDNWAIKGWHIDHIQPLSKFDLSDPEQLAKACHYTNLQPMWHVDNILKSNN